MKKVFLAVLIVLFTAGMAAAAVTWHTTNQATVQWNAVTTYADGTAIAAEDGAIVYELLRVSAATADKTGAVSIGTTDQTQFTITLTEKGEYYVGVKAIMNNLAGEKMSESTITWSDTVGFGIRYYPALSAPGGFGPQ